MTHSAADSQGQQESYCPPRDDINAPDLYIPAMAFVTHVLLVGLNTGLASKYALFYLFLLQPLIKISSRSFGENSY